MTGGLVAVVPMRSLREGKARLDGALEPAVRTALIRRMLLGVIGAINDSLAVDAVGVVSPDPAALELVLSLGPQVVPVAQSSAAPGLNPALERGRTWATERHAAGMLVLFGDLPLLSAPDIQHIVRRDAPVVISPDRHGTGTNAILLRSGDESAAAEFRFLFGPGSYQRHVEEAHRLGLEVATSITPGTAIDLDTPDDLRLLGIEPETGSLDHLETVRVLRGAAR
ncbi:MAG: 2-phospho-L-lactate guanylyltransferase [Thermomicrobiales bacterium]